MKLAKVLTENSSPEEWEVIRKALLEFSMRFARTDYVIYQQHIARNLVDAMIADIQESSQEIMNF